MLSPHQEQVREADRTANRICRHRLMHCALAIAAAWFTLVNPFTLEVRTEGGWAWLGAVIGVSCGGACFALWSMTAGDRRAWLRAFEQATQRSAEAASTES